MRIVLVMSETSLWKPQFVQDLIEKMTNSNEIVGTVLTNFQPRGVSKLQHIKRYFIMLGPWVFILMTIRGIYHSIADIVDRFASLHKAHSIAGVCRRSKIPTIFTKNVNSQKTINWIQKLEPDILLSSGNQIFEKKLLEVPKITSLNRHTSLLPAYGGIYPIFWCMLNNEEKVGVSVHTMTRKIDEGIVIAQRSLQINPGDTFFSLYEKCFKLSVDVVFEAMRKVESGDFHPIISGLENSYYSYPGWKDVHKFRKMGKKIL